MRSRLSGSYPSASDATGAAHCQRTRRHARWHDQLDAAEHADAGKRDLVAVDDGLVQVEFGAAKPADEPELAAESPATRRGVRAGTLLDEPRAGAPGRPT
jgi:hypothetical protein